MAYNGAIQEQWKEGELTLQMIYTNAARNTNDVPK